MGAEVRFRVILPVAQCVSSTLFGGFGLWERWAFLSQRVFENGTLWNSSVAFHYWPWPYKFAAVLNFPALLATLLLSWPVSERWPTIPESAWFALSLPFVVLLWLGIGHWFDRRWGSMDGPPNQTMPWMLLLLFTLCCAGGASVYITSSSDYLLSGVVIWTAVSVGLAVSALYRKFRSRAT
jgi:hypothetical protein